jgi:hypothetical protein
MKNYDELISLLTQGASISRERNMNLDFARGGQTKLQLQSKNCKLSVMG